MGTRDRFMLKLTCPKCGAYATANVSETDYRYSPADFHIDSMPEDFCVTKQGEHRYAYEFRHVCGTTFKLPPPDWSKW